MHDLSYVLLRLLSRLSQLCKVLRRELVIFGTEIAAHAVVPHLFHAVQVFVAESLQRAQYGILRAAAEEVNASVDESHVLCDFASCRPKKLAYSARYRLIILHPLPDRRQRCDSSAHGTEQAVGSRKV